jgi:MGT family glycosyltransferase
MYRHLYLNQIPASFLPEEEDAAAIPTRRDFRPASFVEPRTEAPRWLLDMEPGSITYVTLGSILGAVWPDAFERVVEAVAQLGKTVVVTVGRGGDCKALADRFPRVRVANYIPQRFVLDRAALVICHGGINTVLGALSHGVPVLVLPTEQSDQPWNAGRCRQLGVGLSIDIEQADVPAIRESASALLNESSYRRSATRWQDEMLRLAPMEDAVELFFQLASHRG